ncbi:MAG TPA: DUF4202 domain-containing protein [Cyclobacteriaceae bacterium]
MDQEQQNRNRFSSAIKKFDDYNAADPNGKELVYARRMSERLEQFKPDSPEYIKLAVHCQHIGRWKIPRNTYPEGKKGYIAWRNKLKDFHAETAGAILAECSYDQDTIDKVKDLLEKKDLRSNPGTQLLEDVVCLVFIEFYLEEFADRHDDVKVIDILTKTLKKMSAPAIATASTVHISDRMKELLTQATGTAR